METDSDLMDIEACRTCGVFFLTNSNFLRKIYSTIAEDPEMTLIRIELASWKVEMSENDGYPQYICTGCISEFQNVFKFRQSCLDIQQDLRHFYNLRLQNNIKLEIKTEIEEPIDDEDNICGFIYVDDLSDGEYDGNTPFNIPHMPIKEERIEGATLPKEPGNLMTAVEVTPSDIMVTIPSISSTPASEARQEEVPVLIKAERKSVSQDNEEFTKITFETPSNSVNEIQCSLCLHISSTETQHREHMHRIHEVKNIECHICGKKFQNSTTSRLKFHLKWHRLRKHIKCVQCGFFCNSRDTLNEHTRAVHSKINCNICGKLLFAKKLRAHMREHLANTDLQCTYCSDLFSTDAEREQHIWAVHAKEDSNINHKIAEAYEMVCSECDQKYTNQNDLQLHILEHHQPNYTDQRFSKEAQAGIDNYTEFGISAESVEPNHLSIDQQNIPENSYCNYATTGSLSYERDDPAEFTNIDLHIAEPENEYPIDEEMEMPKFACAQCTQTFATIDQLRAHHTEHNKKPSFSCHLCDKTFVLKFSLNRHLKKHKKTF